MKSSPGPPETQTGMRQIEQQVRKKTTVSSYYYPALPSYRGCSRTIFRPSMFWSTSVNSSHFLDSTQLPP